MESIISFSATAMLILAIALVAPLIYYWFWKSRISASKKTAPPEPAGAWPIIGHMHLLAGSQSPHVTLGNLADKYGPIFILKLGLNRSLVVNSWEMAKECLTTNDKAFASRPKSLAMEILGYNYSMPGFSPYGPYWRQMRKIITLELLSKHRLEMLKHVREAEVKAAIQWLYRQWLKNRSTDSNKLLVEMKRWFGDITLNAIIKLIVGKRYVEYMNSTKGVDEDGWRQAMRDFSELSGKFVVADSLPFLRWLDLGGYEEAMKKTAKELDFVVGRWLEDHKKKKASRIDQGQDQDFMGVMLSLLDDAKELSSFDVDAINKTTSLALIVAASDTTAITLTWTLSLLLNNPDVLRKAHEEVDIHVGRERQVEESDIENLVYLQAILKESFRLYPAAPLSLPHASIEDCNVAGFHVPAGTQLLVNISKIHRDPRVWSEPNEFRPKRFLTTHKEVDIRGQNFELIPFGSGRRMCPGISFALQILNLTLAKLLQGFEIEIPTGKAIDMTESPGLTNSRATPLEVLLTPRLPDYLYETTEQWEQSNN